MSHKPAKLFNGAICKKGHGTLRYRIGGACVQCALINAHRVKEGTATPNIIEWPRAKAVVKGKSRYQGLDCTARHGGLRYTADRKCVECTRIGATSVYRAKRDLLNQTCLGCGALFVPLHMGNRFCCDECRHQRKREQSRASYARNHIPKPPRPTKPPRPKLMQIPQTCVYCGGLFVRSSGSQVSCRSEECIKLVREKENTRNRKKHLALRALEELGIEI